MKRCPECRREYDNSMMFCLDDGAELLYGPAMSEPPVPFLPEEGWPKAGVVGAAGGQFDEPATAILSGLGVPTLGGSVSEPGAIATGFRGDEGETTPFINTIEQTAILYTGTEAEPLRKVGSWRRQLAVLAIAVLILAVGGFFGYRYFSPTKQIESIAVMPFVNESGNADIEYLSDGMTETLIRSLSQLANLQVKPRSSVFRYKGKETDAKTIGSELNVQAILNGRVIQRGDQLTLNLELIDAQKDVVLWSEQYNRKQTDLVALQSEVAKDVSAKLKLKLSGADEAKVTKSATADPEAYQAYLKGRYYWNRRTGENIKKAIEQFKAATDRDPGYALAYAGLADCYVVLPQYAGTPITETIPQAKAFAERAIAIDDQLAEPHASLGNVYKQSWQWAESEREFKRALELNPNYATTYHWYSILLLNLGRSDEALALIQRAQELDPLSSVISANVAWVQQRRGNYQASIESSLRLIELDPNFAPAYDTLCLSYLKTGRNAEAIAASEKSVQLSTYDLNLGDLGYVYAMTGKRTEAIAVIKDLEEKYSSKEANALTIAAVYSGLGNKDEAFQWLEKGFQNKEDLGTNSGQIPFESLRDDPRYAGLLKRMGLPE